MSERPISEFSRAFSLELAAFMRANKINQDHVAERIGKRRSYVSEHTNGTRSPTTDIIDAVADLSGEWTTQALVHEILRRLAAKPGTRFPLPPGEADLARSVAQQVVAQRAANKQPPTSAADRKTSRSVRRSTN